MKNTLPLTQVNNVNEVNTTAEYVGVHQGNRYFGKFVDASTGTFYTNKHFVWNGSVFPQGIPFECLDAVYAV